MVWFGLVWFGFHVLSLNANLLTMQMARFTIVLSAATGGVAFGHAARFIKTFEQKACV